MPRMFLSVSALVLVSSRAGVSDDGRGCWDEGLYEEQGHSNRTRDCHNQRLPLRFSRLALGRAHGDLRSRGGHQILRSEHI